MQIINAHQFVLHQFIDIPKNACTSILRLGHKMPHWYSVEKVHEVARAERKAWDHNGLHTFAVVRDPWARFVSTWHNKVYKPHRPDTGLIKVEGANPGCSLDSFCEWFLWRGLDTIKDMHLRPQVEFLPIAYLHTIDLLPHEDLNSCWEHFQYEEIYGALPHDNSSGAVNHLTECPYRQKIESFYSQDNEIWLEAMNHV